MIYHSKSISKLQCLYERNVSNLIKIIRVDFIDKNYYECSP